MRGQKQTIPGLGLILFAALVGVPLAEIGLFIAVGGRIGLWATLALVVLTAVLGAWMLRWQGFAVLARARRQLAADTLPVTEVFEGLCLVIAGALLLTPGFLTDALGAVLLLRPVRLLLYRQLGRRLAVHVRGHGAHGAAKSRTGPVIEGDFEEIDPRPDRPRPEERPVGDTTMPPPRGGWDRSR